MTLLSLFFSLHLSFVSNTIRIAVIDTGLNLADSRLLPHLCKTDHKDFTGSGLNDKQGHGTHVAGLIEEYAGPSQSYCLIILKFFDGNSSGEVNAQREIEAMKYAAALRVDFVNISGGGPVAKPNEENVISSHPNTTFVVSAGNEGQDLDRSEERYYPASYPLSNIVAVGCVKQDGTRCQSSNYGSFVTTELGNEVYSTLPGGVYGAYTGTSMSAAIHTGKLVRKRIDVSLNTHK